MQATKTIVNGGMFLVFVLFCANVLPTLALNNRAASLDDWARQAVSPQPNEAGPATAVLREAGTAGLKALEAMSPAGENDQFEQRWNWAVERVGAQRDNWASRLYWYTDLEKAKAAAREQKKPILSLRLLGNLDEELSCANSRFFRTALYPHAQVNKALREGYILHWQSVRPVPKVSIDFGDGRKMETTITGNSIHYALDSQGRILDALPGLYGPGAFARWLESTKQLERDTRSLDAAARQRYLKQAHQRGLASITREWQEDIARTKAPLATPSALQQTTAASRLQTTALTAGPDEILIAAPTARTAAPLAMTKMVVEAPLLRRFTVAVPRDRAALERKTDDALWDKIAALHLSDARLDETGLKVLQSKTPRAQIIAANFEKSIALDTVRNEYQRHGILHRWLAQNPDTALDEFNAKVYAELFQTPDSDPWLGLLPTEVYTGIINDGITTARP